MFKKLNIQDVKDRIIKIGHIPDFEEYINCESPLKCICKKHGEFYITLDSVKRIMRGKNPYANGCMKCWREMQSNDLEQVLKEFIEKDLTPLFTEYKRTTEKLPYICNKHPKNGTQYTTLHNVRHSGMVCRECKREDRSNWQRGFTTKEVKDLIISKGFIPHFDEYISGRQRLKIECPKHGIFTNNFYNIRNSNPCKKCADERLIKYTDAERMEYREARGCHYYIVWRKTVLSRDNYACQCCGDKNQLHAHHILNFLTHVELRYDTENGIALCKKCHTKFHRKYGIRLNNKKQVKEFLGENKIGNQKSIQLV